MAIGSLHAEWLSRLVRKGAFLRDGAALLDLGPQDIQVPKMVLRGIALRHLQAAQASDLLARIYDGEAPRRSAQRQFYNLFGVADYCSVDLDDDRAHLCVDLNRLVPPEAGRFDIVTNFGTGEHVFNIGQVFASTHDLLKPGGVSLYAVPAFGFINHGFYNVHPNLYVEMARSNGYELVDFCYINNMFVRNRQCDDRPDRPYDFDALPIKLRDMENTQFFMTKVVSQFYRNLLADDTRQVLVGLSPKAAARDFPGPDFHVCFVFDLCFVALRKSISERAFVMPIQEMTGVRRLESRWSFFK